MTTDHLARNEAVGIASSSPPTTGQGRSRLDRPSPPAPRLIGVGVDGTPSGRDAVVLASLLGRATDAELMLIAVYDEPVLEPLVPSELGWTTVQKQARTMLAATRDSLAPEARIVVETGVLVSRALESVVRRQHRDLLVIGSGHHGTEGQVRLGRSTRELLGGLECPLAIAPGGMRNLPQPALERIGVGFDGEPEARAALELAASIAGAAGAELEVRGVVDDRVPGGLRTEQIVLAGESIVAGQVDSLAERSLIAVKGRGVPARVQVTPGDPSEALRSLAAEVDLLVIGSSRSGPAGRPSLGRTGKTVTAGSPCPVMIVPGPRDDSAI